MTDERQGLEDALVIMETKGLEQGKFDFLSQQKVPGVEDLNAYGVLKSIDGMPAHTEAILERPGVLRDWYQRMDQIVQSPV